MSKTVTAIFTWQTPDGPATRTIEITEELARDLLAQGTPVTDDKEN